MQDSAGLITSAMIIRFDPEKAYEDDGGDGSWQIDLDQTEVVVSVASDEDIPPSFIYRREHLLDSRVEAQYALMRLLFK